MKTDRRRFWGVLAGCVAAPFVPKAAPVRPPMVTTYATSMPRNHPFRYARGYFTKDGESGMEYSHDMKTWRRFS